MVSLTEGPGERAFYRVRTISGYVVRDSVLSNLNPLVKLSLIPFVAIYVVFMNMLEANLLSLSVVIICFKLSKVKLSELGRYLRILAGFLLVVVVSYVLFGSRHDSNPLTCTTFPRLYVESLVTGLSLYSKILVAILLMVLTLSITTVGDVVKGFSSLGLDFRVSFVVGLVFKFLYYLQIKFEEVRLGEASRGLSPSSINVVGKMRCFLHRFLPLLAIAMLKVDEVSDILELRGFSLRTQGIVDEELRLSRKDLVAFLLLISAAVVIVYLSLAGVLQPSNSILYRILLQYSVSLKCPAL